MTISRRLYWLLPIFLFASISTKADSAQVYFDGSYAIANNGYGIGPYGGTLDKLPALFYCVDFSHDIVGNTGWTATVTNLGPSATYSPTRLNNQNTYDEMAWLVTKMIGTTDATLHADYQWAIWSLSVGSNPNAPYDPNSLNALLINNASAAVAGGWSPNGWEILTPQGSYGQEFLVHPAPEPSSILLLLTAFVVFALLGLKKWRGRLGEIRSV